jgi:hypothetical protein
MCHNHHVRVQALIIVSFIDGFSSGDMAPLSFLSWWWQLLIQQGLCEIMIRLVQPRCVSDSHRESPSLDCGPCGYEWEICIDSISEFCKLIPPIHATNTILLIKEGILPCCVDFLCAALSQLGLIYYHIVIVRTVKDWDKILGHRHHVLIILR